MRITEDMLRDEGACKSQLDEFCRRFPDGVTFKDEAGAVAQCVAVANVFDWDAAANLLIQMPLLGDYKAETRSAWIDYKKTLEGITNDFHTALPAAWSDYLAASATAFARAFVSQFDEEGVQE